MKNNINIYEIMERLEAVLSPYPHPLMLHEPCFEGNEWEYTKQCLDSGWVSSAGKYVEKFEQHLADFTGVKQAVALVNGTAALHLSLRLAGVKAGEEVLLPALTFIATATAGSYIKAVPHFVDSSNTPGPDRKTKPVFAGNGPSKSPGIFQQVYGRRISALIVMHLWSSGRPGSCYCVKIPNDLIQRCRRSPGFILQRKTCWPWGPAFYSEFQR